MPFIMCSCQSEAARKNLTKINRLDITITALSYSVSDVLLSDLYNIQVLYMIEVCTNLSVKDWSKFGKELHFKFVRDV